MTLTTVVGSSGSGKTTFLNEVYDIHRCIYIRQYHSMRAYIPVSKIPNFDPTRLPYWDIYVREGKASSIKVGGTSGGEVVVGLSGGQRKILLFELISQRIADHSKILIALDEPFAGVTDDFVPYIVDRLNQMRRKHNVVLVTNDHVETLTELSDNKITVSAIDRATVKINERVGVDRKKAIFALSVGQSYAYSATSGDLKFFFDVELNSGLVAIATFTTFCYGAFLVAFWDLDQEQASSMLVAGGIISYLCIAPLLFSLVEWRINMQEEAEALVHASPELNKTLKTTLALTLLFIISGVQYVVTTSVVKGFREPKFAFAILMDNISVISPQMFLGTFSHLDFGLVNIFGSIPFQLMSFLSTAFSPGSGVTGVKELRYIWARFYFWCMVPDVQDQMEGCPSSPTLNFVLLVASSLLGTFLFFVWRYWSGVQAYNKLVKTDELFESHFDEDFHQLQIEMYGQRMLLRFQGLSNSLHSRDSRDSRDSRN